MTPPEVIVLLKSVRVQMFRNFVDSGEVLLDPQVTALVGKNESGKTALLQALRCLRPARGEWKLSLHDDYPRWLLKEHELDGALDDARPVAVAFELTEKEFDDLTTKYGQGSVLSRELTIDLDYAGRRLFSVKVDERAAVLAYLASCDDDVAAAVRDASTIVDLRQALKAQITAGEPDPDASMPGNPALLDRLRAAATGLDQLIPPAGDLQDAVINDLDDLIPLFFYFSEYDFLPGRANKSKLIAALQSADISKLNQELGEHTAARFLQLAKAGATGLGTREYEVTKAEMEATANLLSKQIREYWRQNEYLRFEIDIEHEVTPHPNGGERITTEWVQFRVKDTRHEFSNNLDRRSTGFRWFISFFASFAEFQTKRDVIVLLDEPGLSLHGRAQDDLLRLIDEKLAPKHQVIYTTHSPWLVPTGHLERVRIVEDSGPEIGATVSDQPLARDPDTLFPLQAALGYDLAQHLFIGPDNLAVEGPSDHIYLTTMSAFLASEERAHLYSSWRILPCAGIDTIATFVALIGPHLDVTVLIDSSTKPNQRISNMVDRSILKAKRLVSIGQVVGLKEADIEDLFEVGEYLDLFSRTFGSTLAEADLQGSDRIVARIERATGTAFDHGRVAETFLKTQAEILPKLSSATLARFEALFGAINETRSE